MAKQTFELLPEGVFSAQKKSGEIYYRSSLTYKRKHISLGSFSSPELAHEAYETGKKIIDHKYQPEDYETTHALSFEKWIILLNFRDNDIYFSNPIYVRNKYFEYYLSPSQCLIFDIDDLFYFSSHKIMQRGGHLFVADYGMQINILSRFQIRSYAIEGVDYRFANGNSLDFRRENLILTPTYHGVRPQSTKDGIKYKTRIHINGYYVVGTYETIIEAAIAYNKAIDILKKKGNNKNYMINYIDNLSPSQYADIYAECKISRKILNWSPTE